MLPLQCMTQRSSSTRSTLLPHSSLDGIGLHRYRLSAMLPQNPPHSVRLQGPSPCFAEGEVLCMSGQSKSAGCGFGPAALTAACKSNMTCSLLVALHADTSGVVYEPESIRPCVLSCTEVSIHLLNHCRCVLDRLSRPS